MDNPSALPLIRLFMPPPRSLFLLSSEKKQNATNLFFSTVWAAVDDRAHLGIFGHLYRISLNRYEFLDASLENTSQRFYFFGWWLRVLLSALPFSLLYFFPTSIQQATCSGKHISAKLIKTESNVTSDDWHRGSAANAWPCVPLISLSFFLLTYLSSPFTFNFTNVLYPRG